jgi:flagellar hook assembly protein FlgD
VLAQNTPNPFNPRTVIRFDLGRESRVRLEVFDVAGRLVRVLQDGRLPAGNHVAAWDGRDDHGRQLSSGTYFYRLDDGDQELTRKMLMLR